MLTIDDAISKLTELREKSSLGGKTILVLCEQNREYEEFSKITLDTDPDMGQPNGHVLFHI